MQCQYCNNTFASKSNLVYHQKTAKYCLKIRNCSTKKSKFKCQFCDKMFNVKSTYSKHHYSCSNSSIGIKMLEILKRNIFLEEECKLKDNLLEKYEQKIKELQDKLENIALKAVLRPTTTKNTQINNYIQKLDCVTDQHLQDQVQHLTIEHIQKGPEGYAEYALEYPLKNRIVCVDYSRRKVKFKDKDGNVVTDPEMATIATKLFQSIKDKNKDLIMSYGNELKDKFGDEMGTVIELLGYKSGVDDGAGGSKSDFYHDFVKSVCGKSVLE